MLDVLAIVRNRGAGAGSVAPDGVFAGVAPRLAGDWGELHVGVDASYRVATFPEGVVFHDGRVRQWEQDPARWSGSFVAFAVARDADGTAAGLAAIGDLVGTVPLYLARGVEFTYIASKLPHLARLGFASLDRLGACELLFFDQPLWERTLLRGVELLPPASICTLTRGKAPDVRRYWRAPLAGDAVAREEVPLVEGLVERLAAAHVRALEGVAPIAFPLTGGLDSRMNLALDLGQHGTGALLFHCENPGTLEASIVKSIAGKLGLPLHTFPEAEGLRAIPALDPLNESGELGAAQYWLAPAVASLAGRARAATLIDGYLQDFLFNPLLVSPESDPSSADRLMRTARFRASLVDPAFDPVLVGQIEQHFRDGYAGEGGPLDASQRHYMENRSRRFVLGCARLAQNHLRVLMPACDRELVEFALSLPFEQRHGARAYRRAIARIAPALAAEIYDRTGLPVSAEGGTSWRFEAGRRVHRLLDQVWPARRVLREADADFDTLLRDDGKLRAALASSLANSEWVAEVLGRRRGAEALLARQRDGANVGGLLLNLLTVAKLESVRDGRE